MPASTTAASTNKTLGHFPCKSHDEIDYLGKQTPTGSGNSIPALKSQTKCARLSLLRWFSSEENSESFMRLEGFGDSHDNIFDPRACSHWNWSPTKSQNFGQYHWASMLVVSSFLVSNSPLRAISAVLSGSVLLLELLLLYVLFPLLLEKFSAVYQVVDQLAKNHSLSVTNWLSFSSAPARIEYQRYLVSKDRHWRFKAFATSLLAVAMVLTHDSQKPLLSRARHVPVAAHSIIQLTLIFQGPLSYPLGCQLDLFGYLWVPFLRLCNTVYRCTSQPSCSGYWDEEWEESYETFDNSLPTLMKLLKIFGVNFFVWGIFKYLTVSQVSLPATALSFAILLAGHALSRMAKILCLTGSGLPVPEYAYANLELCLVSFALVYVCVVYVRLLLEERYLTHYLQSKMG